MKKIFLILILFLSCYFIYEKTNDKKEYYLTIGDFLSKGVNEYGVSSYGYSDFVKDYLKENKSLKDYNRTFTDNNYRIIDVLKILEYNEMKDNISLNRLIKQADIITISLGMNEIYYKLENSNQNIYTYIDTMINDYNKLLKYINNFHHEKVFVLGYYNAFSNQNDIFNYANYNLKKICDENGVVFIDLTNIFYYNCSYLPKNNIYSPNIDGYRKISQIIIENL